MKRLDFKINREMILAVDKGKGPCRRGWRELVCSMSSQTLTDGFIITGLEGKTSDIDDMFWATKALGPEYAFHLRMFATWASWVELKHPTDQDREASMLGVQMAHGSVLHDDVLKRARELGVANDLHLSKLPGSAVWLSTGSKPHEIERFKQMVADGGWVGGIEGLWESEK